MNLLIGLGMGLLYLTYMYKGQESNVKCFSQTLAAHDLQHAKKKQLVVDIVPTFMICTHEIHTETDGNYYRSFCYL